MKKSNANSNRLRLPGPKSWLQRKRQLLLVAQLLVSVWSGAMAAPQKLSLSYDGEPRTYYVLVPDGVFSSAPLILLLHGSGRDGMSQMGAWKKLAEEKKIILVAPDSKNSQEWSMIADGPEFLHSVVEAVKAANAVDGKRVYIFGHSAGATFALYMAVMESQYFAAAAVHAGALPGDFSQYMDHAQRKIPIAIWVGDKDQFFSLDAVRSTRDQLAAHGFTVRLTEMKGHDHDYYSVAGKLNETVWEFLSASQLPSQPSWEKYRTR
jgi:poly(3-hydroxybutyrate) depolymerase